VVSAIRTPDAEARVWEALREVADPEIPAISVVDLGVIGSVAVSDEAVRVELLPTFIGGPATAVMQERVTDRIRRLEIAPSVDVRVSYAEPWTSDRISAIGREQLRASGFAPPALSSAVDGLEELTVLSGATCPYCGSRATTLENPFGPTLCRSIYHCDACRQPFEQFKTV
jgi:ring-1,2-phenylacetyl-CoA epoxidase subunit PaaD